MSIPHYNVNPNQRPSNESLSRESYINSVLSAGIGGFWASLAYLFTGKIELGYVIPLSVAITGVLFICYHFHRGYRKKKDFIAAGGNPEGLSLWMFGSMRGKLLADGTWQWKKLKPARDDYYGSEMTALKEEMTRN